MLVETLVALLVTLEDLVAAQVEPTVQVEQETLHQYHHHKEIMAGPQLKLQQVPVAEVEVGPAQLVKMDHLHRLVEREILHLTYHHLMVHQDQ